MSELQVQKSRETEFQDTLVEFEACVETPFVPGELPGWVSSAQAALERFIPTFDRQLKKHQSDFEQIREQDQELHQRVATMQADDAALRELSRDIAQQLERLRTAAGLVEPDEALLRDTMHALVDDAIAFIVQIRKQEQAVRTWLMEAFNRDRGTVD
jgi:hypothetical protein